METPTISHPTGLHNLSIVNVAGIQYGFSYRTCVAFRAAGHLWVVHENDWGPTTGKHLNYFNEDKSTRLPEEQFQAALVAAQEAAALVWAP